MTQYEWTRALKSRPDLVGFWRFPAGVGPFPWCAILLLTPEEWRGSGVERRRREAAERLSLRYERLGIATFLAGSLDVQEAVTIGESAAAHPLASRRRRLQVVVPFEHAVPAEPILPPA